MIKPFIITANSGKEAFQKIVEFKKRVSNGEDPEKVAKEMGARIAASNDSKRIEFYSSAEVPSSFEEVIESFSQCEMPSRFSAEDTGNFVDFLKKLNPVTAFQLLAKHLSNIFIAQKENELEKPLTEFDVLYCLDLARLKIVGIPKEKFKEIKTFRNNAFFTSEEEAKLTLELLKPLTEIISEQ